MSNETLFIAGIGGSGGNNRILLFNLTDTNCDSSYIYIFIYIF